MKMMNMNSLETVLCRDILTFVSQIIVLDMLEKCWTAYKLICSVCPFWAAVNKWQYNLEEDPVIT